MRTYKLILATVIACITVTAAGAHNPSFAEKHPKLHKAGRKIRKTCTVLQPVVSFAGSVAQVISLGKR